MPSSKNYVRNYRQEYDAYQGTPEQKKRRAARNKARAMMSKKGLVKKGDGKDVNHISYKDPLVDRPSNLNIQTSHNNRSFPRDKGAKHKKGTK